MNNTIRLEVYPKQLDRKSNLLATVQRFYPVSQASIDDIQHAKIYWIESAIDRNQCLQASKNALVDDVEQIIISGHVDIFHKFPKYVVEMNYKPGVTDNTATAALEALCLVNPTFSEDNLAVYTGDLFFVFGNLSKKEIENIAHEYIGNQLLNDFKIWDWPEFSIEERFLNNPVPRVCLSQQSVACYDLNVSDEKMMDLNRDNCWALSADELGQIKKHFQEASIIQQRYAFGLGADPTDVEIEVIAQTWSEHCKHKIFNSNINYSEIDSPLPYKKLGDRDIYSIYKSFIKGATKRIKEERGLDNLISVFSDNAGIVRFDKNIDLCIKVETHNSPSALDPYGGSLTGILGVNRDILGCGLGARPIANTDVFCFAPEDMLTNKNIEIPVGLKNPSRIAEGVHLGIEDGGNKSGIPTVNGAFLFDDQYAGKPLVFCGTVGVLPQKTERYKDTFSKNQKPGDYIVMSGGRIGKDGIHGATFSSMELDENSPVSAVQIGDPITQKRVSDFLVEARDNGLFSSVTDNGAGGLSSSVGEMAELTNGAIIDLQLAPVKYPGLAPYELMISESQERMTFAVGSDQLEEFLNLSTKRGVESTVLGQFTDDGFLTIKYGEKVVAALSLQFLHSSLSPMNLTASFTGPADLTKYRAWHGENRQKQIPRCDQGVDYKKLVEEIIASPNICSKEHLVRRYDHEVQASTIVKPFIGKEGKGPSDAAVLWLAPAGGERKNGITISSGINSFVSHYDTYTMAQMAIDETVRNSVCVGADPKRMVLLDNFCWPDPIKSENNPDGDHKLAQLVRASIGLYDASVAYGMPFVSGKDSMKNDFIGKTTDGNKVKISVPPTLLITGMAQIEDVENVVTSDFKQAKDYIYLLGDLTSITKKDLNICELSKRYQIDQQQIIPCDIDLQRNLSRYNKIHQATTKGWISSCHDLSEGGMVTSIIESSIGGEIGVEIDLSTLIADKERILSTLFNEVSGSFIISVSEINIRAIETLFDEEELSYIGRTASDDNLSIKFEEEIILQHDLQSLLNSWRQHGK